MRELPPADGPIFIVLNAGSGRQDEQARQDSITRAMDEAGRRHELFRFDRRRPITAVAQEAVQAAVSAKGVVVAAGGDGTINAVAQAAIGSDCAFGVLPQGTFNYFGRTHEIPEDTDAALELLLSGTPTAAQIGCVNDKIFLVNASLGLYPDLLEDREAFKNRFGRSRLMAMFSAIGSLLGEHRQLLLNVDWRNAVSAADGPSAGAVKSGGLHQLRTPTLFVGNNRLQLEQIGVAEADELSRGRLVALAPRAVGTAALFGLALRGAIGQLGEAESVRSLAFERLSVLPAGRLGRRRFKIATDGELTWMKPPFVFKVFEKPLWLIKKAEVASDAAAAGTPT